MLSLSLPRCNLICSALGTRSRCLCCPCLLSTAAFVQSDNSKIGVIAYGIQDMLLNLISSKTSYSKALPLFNPANSLFIYQVKPQGSPPLRDPNLLYLGAWALVPCFGAQSPSSNTGLSLWCCSRRVFTSRGKEHHIAQNSPWTGDFRRQNMFDAFIEFSCYELVFC